MTRGLTLSRLRQGYCAESVMRRMKTRRWFQQLGLELHRRYHLCTVRSGDLTVIHELRSGQHPPYKWGMFDDALLTMVY
jgi:hypothetical protein